MSVLGYSPLFEKIIKVYSAKTADTLLKCLIRILWLYDAINQLETLFELIIKRDHQSEEALSTIWSSTLS